MTIGNKERIWIAAKLGNTISVEDDILLSQWLNASESNQKLFEEATRIWNHSGGKVSIPETDTDQEWLRLLARLEGNRDLQFYFSQNRWLGVAAGFALIAIVGLFLLVRKSEEIPVVMVTLHTDKEVQKFQLPDSSVVWLNVNSRLAYAPDFGTADRKVKLYGEGYFTVFHDSISFEIQTPLAYGRVLGTQFNLKATDSITEVTVREGTVGLSSRQSNEYIELHEGDMGTSTAAGLSRKRYAQSEVAPWRMHNNPDYNAEQTRPVEFISTQNDWEKNTLNQSVIEGTLTSRATLATYKNIILNITYTRSSGKKVVSKYVVEDILQPGQTIQYRKRLLDIFSNTQKVEVEVVSADVVLQ